MNKSAMILEIKIKKRWWVDPYVQTLAWFCLTFQCEPDLDKVTGFLVRWGFSIQYPLKVKTGWFAGFRGLSHRGGRWSAR